LNITGINITGILLDYYWNNNGINISGILPEYYWNFTGILLEFYLTITAEYYCSCWYALITFRLLLDYCQSSDYCPMSRNITVWVEE